MITGGRDTFTTVSVYSVQGWQEDLPSLNIERYEHACTSYMSAGKRVSQSLQIICIYLKLYRLQMLLVSGGYDESDIWLDSTEIFDPSLKNWRAGATLPSPVYGLRAANIDKRVLLFGNRHFTHGFY